MTPTRHAEAIGWMTGDGSARPKAVGSKFTPEGRVMAFPGNTFICHIDPASAAHRALITAQDRLRAGPLAGAFTFLPPSSLHMTVFEGVCDAYRDPGVWPDDLDPALPVADVTRAFLADLPRANLPDTFAIRPTGVFAGFSVSVTGATPDDDARLATARHRLRDLTGIRRADFATYRFHITLAYLLRWLTNDEATAVQDLSDQILMQLLATAPVITLGPVEFCQFDEMHAFKTLKRLG